MDLLDFIRLHYNLIAMEYPKTFLVFVHNWERVWDQLADVTAAPELTHLLLNTMDFMCENES